MGNVYMIRLSVKGWLCHKQEVQKHCWGQHCLPAETPSCNFQYSYYFLPFFFGLFQDKTYQRLCRLLTHNEVEQDLNPQPHLSRVEIADIYSTSVCLFFETGYVAWASLVLTAILLPQPPDAGIIGIYHQTQLHCTLASMKCRFLYTRLWGTSCKTPSAETQPCGTVALPRELLAGSCLR